jgi:hypothetical protein
LFDSGNGPARPRGCSIGGDLESGCWSDNRSLAMSGCENTLTAFCASAACLIASQSGIMTP